MIFWLSLPLHLPTPLPEQKSILFFDTARQFKKNYGNICKWSLRNWTNNSEQDQDRDQDRDQDSAEETHNIFHCKLSH